MKNGHGRHIFISVLLCILVIALFSTCRSRKNVVRNESNQARTERVETKTDTSRVITRTVADMEESVSIQETTDRETIHLDSIGRVRTIVRESVKKETGQRRTDRGQGSVVSITGKSDSITSQETLNATSQEKQDIKTDSRPVQGAEWMWVILSIGTIAAIAILFFIRKVK
jgi:hypothetical protein